jgi:hypothetical protein
LIEEKRSSLIASLPTDAKALAFEVQSMEANFNSRCNSLLPQGVDQIQAITVYMCQCPRETLDSEPRKLSSEDEKVIRLESLQLQVAELSSLKEKNEAAIRQKLFQLASSYNYRLDESFQIFECS